MNSPEPLPRAYSTDFVERLIGRDKEVVHRMLLTADVALAFARALMAKDYAVARTMLTSVLQGRCSEADLERNLKEMIWFEERGEEGWPAIVEVMTGADRTEMSQWPRKQSEDFGWAYVAMEGSDYSEAVAVTVVPGSRGLAIRDIEWGRP